METKATEVGVVKFQEKNLFNRVQDGISREDVLAVVVQETYEKLKADVAMCEKALTSRQTTVNEAVTRLGKVYDRLVAEAAKAVTGAFRKAYALLWGMPVKVSVGRTVPAYSENPKDRTVTMGANLTLSTPDSDHNHTSVKAERLVTVPTKDIPEYRQLKDAEEALELAKTVLLQARRKLQEMPAVERQRRAQIATIAIEEMAGGADLLNKIRSMKLTT